ncbi:MAG TPA: hypothetical protein VNT23_03915 [Gaiellaceae bacterium]|nr:hypothetical protein [Gaiellaceae bacterium]
MRPSREELERRVDELSAEHSGRAFADAVRAYSDGLDEGPREELKAILLRRARLFDELAEDRFAVRGWFRRMTDRLEELERGRRPPRR